jgi:hypothetical protein
MPGLGQEAHCLRRPQLCKHGFVNCCVKSARNRPVPSTRTQHINRPGRLCNAIARASTDRAVQYQFMFLCRLQRLARPLEPGVRAHAKDFGGVLTAERRNDHGRRTSHRSGRALWPCCPLAPPRGVRLLQHRARPAPFVRVAVPPLGRHSRGRSPRTPCERARLGCRSRKRVPGCATASMPRRAHACVLSSFTPPQRPFHVSSASCLSSLSKRVDCVPHEKRRF